MNRIGNPLLMVVPEELLGLAMLIMIVIGGILMIVGARTKGWTLVVVAIAIPFVSVLVQALMNSFFAALPEPLIMPVAWLIMSIVYAMGAMVVVRLIFGDKAVDTAKGQLLADAVKGVLKLMFRWPVMLLWVGALTLYLLMG